MTNPAPYKTVVSKSVQQSDQILISITFPEATGTFYNIVSGYKTNNNKNQVLFTPSCSNDRHRQEDAAKTII
jgi:hypothetical protein